jgi:YrbI family 3-deoxy-D-manno-octulosonate 8-phosphate phosphatase
MVKSAEVLAIIPARGGSKGIPHKNIRDFAGYPLIAYSIAAGLQSELVTRTIVSTDDEAIAAAARECGAETPFLRPAEFAQDATLDLPVFEHALAWLAEHEDYHPDVVVQLRPTSPIRPVGLVDAAVRLLLEHPEADSVRGVVPAGQNPHKMWRVSTDGRMQPLLQVEGVAEPYNAPRQSLPPVFWQTGHIDAIRPETILQKGSMSGDVILSLPVDPRCAVDIDTLSDWRRGEWLVRGGEAGLEMVCPGRRPRPMPERIDLLVMDFDGVLTDNRVWVDQDGRESVAAYRSDSLGLTILHETTGIDMLVLSKEVNPVVTARCKKMGVPCVQGIDDKPAALARILAERGVRPEHVIFIGNDVNDTPCFPIVGWAVAPADAQNEALRQADLVLGRRGGYGAVRELCELLMERFTEKKQP